MEDGYNLRELVKCLGSTTTGKPQSTITEDQCPLKFLLNPYQKSTLIENEYTNHKIYQNKLRAEFQGVLQMIVKHGSFKYKTKKHNLEKITLISTF